MPRRTRGEGTLYYMKAVGLWCAEATFGKRPDGRPDRRKFYGHSPEEALQKRDEAKRQAEEGRLPTPNRVTVAEYAQKWLRDIAALGGRRRTGLAQNTLECYENALNHLIRAYGGLRLRDLTGQHLTALYVQMRERGLSPRQCQLVHVVSGMMCRSAVAERLIPRSPAEAVAHPPRPEADEPNAMTPEEAARLLGAAQGSRWAAAWRLALDALLGRGELLGLQWRDLDLETGILRVEQQALRADGLRVGPVKTKNRRRPITLGPDTLQALLQWRSEWAKRTGALPVGTAFIFPAQAGPGRTLRLDPSRPASPESANAAFRKHATAAGLTGFTLHDLRHTGISWLADADVNPRVAAARAGHDVRTMVTWYVRRMQRSEGKAAGVVTERLRGVAGPASAANGDISATEANDPKNYPSGASESGAGAGS